jgi:hypothetical protein
MNESAYLNVKLFALKYFQKPASYFWRWAEAGTVIEWQHGSTIGYREEVQVVMEALVPTGLPPFGAILLLLAACADNWPNGSAGLLEGLVRTAPADPGVALADDVAVHLRHVLPFLDQVAALPQELRTGLPKLHLFRQLSEGLLPAIPAAASSEVFAEWRSGRLDAMLQHRSGTRDGVRSKLKMDVLPLAALARRFETPGRLELLLRTGLPQLPAALPELPAPPAPNAADLFDQLAQDARTAGLAHLTQHLVAALHIPLHTQGASDRPLGGVADITNRGNFDRLLLSELAYDDWSLMARLANNEALYLRREEPPRPQARPHTILLDTTLRLWGTPRVFGLAAALAWIHHAQLPRARAAVETYALGGQTYKPLDLGSIAGVVHALSQLDPALHCGEALHAFAQTQPAAEATDYLLITEAHLAQQADFNQRLAGAAPALRFLLTVDRGGTLELHEYINGHRRLLHTSSYDLNELLFAARVRQPLRPAAYTTGPPYLRQVPAPLYFPTTGVRMSDKNTFYWPSLGVVGITETRRVLFWPNRTTGARELLLAIEPGAYYFGTDDAAHVYVLVSAARVLRVYFFDISAEQVEMVDLVAELDEPQQEVKVVFQDKCYYVRRGGSTLIVDCLRREVRDRRSAHFPASSPPAFRREFNGLKRYINTGYSVIHRISLLGVNGVGELLLDGYEVRLVSRAVTLTHHLQLMSRASSTNALSLQGQATASDLTPATEGPTNRVLTRRFTWPNGSEALIDARGLVHLRSADATVPEMSLLLVIGQPTAAWAADGTVCGPDYFTGPTPAQRLPPSEFYHQYLRRFTAPLA